MTHKEAVILSAYTGFLLVRDFREVHRFCEKLLGRSIFTHEFANPAFIGKVQTKCRPLVEEIIRNAEV